MNNPLHNSDDSTPDSLSSEFEGGVVDSAELKSAPSYRDAVSADPATCEIGDLSEPEIDLSVASDQAFPPDDDSESSAPRKTKTRAKRAPTEETVPKQIGEYRITGLIGSGGMGQVFSAEHVRMQRKVALKILRGDRMSDEASVERFYDEVRAASRVMHPNIVTAFDAGEFGGIHYLVMEYVDGMTLTRLVAKNGPLSPGMAAAVIRQAALGLLHAHRAGIVHRDVKPGNLIRAEDGTIKVLDLGLAQISNVLWSEDGRELGRVQDPDSHHKRKGRLIGTLAYMSPEQLESPDEADPRSDIYSLGAVLFFLLTAKPPYQGEYLDQVYGHRHGEIPDLMQLRSDVDLGLSNLLRRMMAKRLSERYASLDEVVEDLGAYAEESHSPAWLAEFINRQSSGNDSTISGGSTAIANQPVFAIEMAMFYAAAAESVQGIGIHNLTAGGDDQPLFRMAIANDHGRLLFDMDANQMRLTAPRSVVHCLPMYIGKDIVRREIAGRHCPPEVLLALAIRRIVSNGWPGHAMPKLASMVVPACYDQFHRRSIKQASRLAGLESVRLVDRSVAAIQSLLMDIDAAVVSENKPIDINSAETMLFIGLSGQATEVALVKRDGMQLTQLATAGHWHTSMLSWQHRLVTLAAEAFRRRHGFDPTEHTVTASRLQVSCEQAMNSLLMMPEVTISVDKDDASWSITVSRQKWLEQCADLIHGIRRDMHSVCQQAGVHPKKIDSSVIQGPLLRIEELQHRLFKKLSPELDIRVVDHSDIARGAAACLAAELPQRTDLLVPPRCVSSQTIGIVVEDSRGRRRILPIIPRGTKLPARTNRKLTIAKDRFSMTLSVVESSGVRGDKWHSLGRYEFNVDKDSNNQLKRTRSIGFELNVDGLLTVRAQTPGTPESKRLPIIPEPLLDPRDEPEWARWVSALDV